MSGALPEILPTYPDGETEGPVWHRCPPDPDCPYCQKAAGAAPLDWSFVGNVYCISLKTRNDRVERVSKEFHRTGLCQHVIFYRPEKHPKKGIIGSWESHRAVAMDALNRNLETALVFEDDVLFLRKITSALLAQVASTMRALPANWHIYYLGHWPVEAWFIRSNLLRTRSACAHAYIISQHTMRWLRDHPYGTPGIAMTKIIGRPWTRRFASAGNLCDLSHARHAEHQSQRQLQLQAQAEDEVETPGHPVPLPGNAALQAHAPLRNDCGGAVAILLAAPQTAQSTARGRTRGSRRQTLTHA